MSCRISLRFQSMSLIGYGRSYLRASGTGTAYMLISIRRLIVVAEKDDVYERFPIPLINRLEKHLLVMSTGLNERQARLVEQLKEWVELFSETKSGER